MSGTAQMVLLFPGQGSQRPGMGQDVAAAFPAAKVAFDRADAALGFALSTLCFQGPADDLALTQNTQPALLAHSAAVWAVIKDHVGPKVVGAAGHSLGEFSAYHAMGSLSLEDAVRLVRTRGQLMYETGVQVPGAMAAILGELQRPIEDICVDAATASGGVVVPANYNDQMQVVISGEVAAVEAAMELAKAAGGKKAVRLPVSGAFHSPLMAPAAAGLKTALDAATWANPAHPVWSNVTAHPVSDAPAARELLHRQLTAPVRWVELIRQAAARHPGATFVEVGTGTVLSKLVKRIAPDCHTMACGTVPEVEAVLAL